MKKDNSRFLVAGILVAIAIMLVVASISVAASTNYVDLHRKSGTLSDSVCIGCHGNKKYEKSLNSNYPTFHAVHLNSNLMLLNCKTCHVSTDIIEKSAASLRRQVSVIEKNDFGCVTCHSKFSDDMDELGVTISSRCANCHSGYKHEKPYINQSNLNGEAKANGGNCWKCHGGKSWYQVVND